MTTERQLLPEEVIESIEKNLSDKSIQIDWSSIKKSSAQGFMSLVATVESTVGLLVIHYNPVPLEDQRRVNMPTKISSITSYLKEKLPHLPTQEVFDAAKFSNGAYYIVQEYLPGNPLGNREMKGGKIIDTYNIPSAEAAKLQNEVDIFTAQMHMLPVSGFGFLIRAEAGTLRGEHESWEEFLKKGTEKWCKELTDAATLESDDETEERVDKIQIKIAKLYASHEEFFYLLQGYFVHGDIANLSNILVNEGKVTGIIDYEWSLAGDPAWEFTHTEVRPTEPYYQERGLLNSEEKDKFLRHIDFNTVFWSLWGAHLHARINNYGIKEVLLDRVELYLVKFQE